MQDSHNKLSNFTVIIHWIVGVAIIAMLGMGLFMEQLPRGDFKWQLYGIHKSVGVIVLTAASMRALWRIYNGMPSFMAGTPTWQKHFASFVHWLLLIGTLAMPISGLMMTITRGDPVMIFGLELLHFENFSSKPMNATAHDIHYYGGRIMIAAIVIHILAAIKHYALAKNRVVQRMLGKGL